MSHRYRKTPPTTHHYRHFAVITVAVTGLLAVFAEGEKAELHAAPTEQQAAQDSAAESKPVPPPAIQEAGGGWGSDAVASFAGSSGAIGLSQMPASWWRTVSDGGYSPDYLDRLSPDDRAALEAALAESAASTPAEYEARIARLESASRLRSGSAGRD